MQQVSKSFFAWRESFKFIPYSVKVVIGWWTSALVIDYSATSFASLDSNIYIPVWKSMYYFPLILLVFFYVLFMVIGVPKKKGPPKDTTLSEPAKPKSE